MRKGHFAAWLAAILCMGITVTLSGKSRLILGENKAAFRREGHKFINCAYLYFRCTQTG